MLNPHSLASACRRWIEHNRYSPETISSTSSLPSSSSIKTNHPTTSPSEPPRDLVFITPPGALQESLDTAFKEEQSEDETLYK